MNSVNIEKAKLKEIIQKNRETHIAEYEELMNDYVETFKHRLQDKLDQLNAGEIPNTHFREMPMPHSYVHEYDEVLEMLEFSTDNIIELDRTSFANYVRDDWGWKDTFNATKMSYGR